MSLCITKNQIWTIRKYSWMNSRKQCRQTFTFSSRSWFILESISWDCFWSSLYCCSFTSRLSCSLWKYQTLKSVSFNKLYTKWNFEMSLPYYKYQHIPDNNLYITFKLSLSWFHKVGDICWSPKSLTWVISVWSIDSRTFMFDIHNPCDETSQMIP